MQDFRNVYIFGYSLHAYVLIDRMLNLGYKVLGYFHKKEALRNPFKLEFPRYELDVNLEAIIRDDVLFPMVGANVNRGNLIQRFDERNINQYTMVDPMAKVSKTAKIESSAYFGKSRCNAFPKGNGVILNTNLVIEHKCEIADFSHKAPSSTSALNMKVVNKSFIGANSVCKQNYKLLTTV